MKLIVGINKITVDEKDKLNAGEYNIHEVEFEFSEEYNGLVKRAVFSNKEHSYLVELNNGSCIIPYEVLGETGDIQIGAYGYITSGTDLVLRYSPSPVYTHVDIGSYKDSYDNYKQPTADIVEQLTERIETAEQEINEALEEIDGYSSRISDLEDNKVDKVDGKGLSTNDYTDNEQTKLSNIESNAQVNLIEDIKVNGTSQTISEKSVDISVPTQTSQIINNSGFIDKNVNDLIYYTLKTSTGSLIDLEINSSTYVVTLSLKDIDGNVISTDTIDLPLESVVVSGSFDSTNKKIVLTLQNGNTVDIPVGDLVAGLQTEITSNNKLASDLVDDSNSGNKFTNTSEKTTWNNKYDKPISGIPKTDLSSEVQTSLGKADTAIQNTDYATTNVAGVIKSNVNAFMVSSTGYPSADSRTYENYSSAGDGIFISKGTLENVLNARIGDIDSALDTINGEVIS